MCLFYVQPQQTSAVLKSIFIIQWTSILVDFVIEQDFGNKRQQSTIDVLGKVFSLAKLFNLKLTKMSEPAISDVS